MKYFPNHSSIVFFVSGVFGTLIDSVITVPFEIVKKRMQLGKQISLHKDLLNIPTHQYKNGIQAIFNIIRNEGFRGIYHGYLSNTILESGYSAFDFLFYENCKKIYREKYKQEPSVFLYYNSHMLHY